MRRVQFLEFELDLDLLTLIRSGRLVPIGRRCFDLLVYLVRNRPRYVNSETLRREVWGGVPLSPAAIPTCVRELRRLLGDSAVAPRIIESKRSFGYRFVPQCVYLQPERSFLSGSVSQIDFVGRDDELSALRTGLRRVTAAGRLQCVLLRGEAGIGKTRLLSGFLGRAGDSVGRVVLRCHSSSSDAFDFFGDLVNQIAGLNPSLSEGIDSSEGSVEIESALAKMRNGEIDRTRFYSAWVGFFRRASAAGPMVLAFEDIHLAHPEMLNWMAWIIEACCDLPFLVLLTQRPRLVNPEVQWRIDDILALSNVSLIDVGALSVCDVEKLVLLISPGCPLTAESIHSRAGGNPLLVEYAIDLLQGDSGPGCSRGEGRVASRGRDLVARFVSDLPARTRRLLSIGAVLGEPFSGELVGAVDGLSWMAATESLEEARRARLLVVKEDHYEFVHSLLCDALQSALDSTVRKQLHARIARVLVGRGDLERPTVAIAFHLIAGGPAVDRAEAQRFAELATKISIEDCSYAEAKGFAESALSLASHVWGSEHSRHCELMLILAKCHRLLGARREAREIVLRAAAIARRNALEKVLIECALSLSEDFATIDVGVHDMVTEDLLREALRLCPRDNAALKATLLARLSLSLRWSDRPEEQMVLAERACEIGREAGDREALRSGLSSLIESNAGVARAEVRKALLDEVEALGLSHLNPEEVLLHQVRKITALLEMGQVDRVLAENESYRELALKTGQPHYIWYAETTDVMRSMLQGDLVIPDSLESYYRAVLRVTEDPNVIQGYAAQTFFREVECCRQSGVVEPLHAIASRYPLVSGWRAAEAWLRWTLGDEGECVRLLGQMTEDRVGRMTTQAGAGAALGMLCEVASYLGTSELRNLLWKFVEPIVDRCATAGYGVLYFGGYSRYGGLVARSLGLRKKAIELLKFSAEQEASRGAELWRGYSLVDLALAVGSQSPKRALARNILADAERVVRGVRSPRLRLRLMQARRTLA